ncbi:glycine--tRNA ligase [Candidatus Mycoplasma pogonae]
MKKENLNAHKNMKELVNHLKNVGFVFQGSEIYGGLANTWDYGPLGALIAKKVKDLWWNNFITKEASNYGLDSKILMSNLVWEASGHTTNFSDPLIENKINKKRYRADKIMEELFPEINVGEMNNSEIENFLRSNVTKYDNSAVEWGPIRNFNLMFETQQGVLEDAKNKVYLRPETAQGIFVNFKNIVRTMRPKLPFGIGQIGKAFRNEITPGNFIFRTREFEQMELEVFTKETEADAVFANYIAKANDFLVKVIELKPTSLLFRQHADEELAHYSKATTDIEFAFPFGWGELWGIANRGNHDLKAHMEHSKENFYYTEPETNQNIIPFVIEPSLGLDRLLLAIFVDAYEIEKLTNNNDERIVLRLAKSIAPYTAAILPLTKKQSSFAKEIFTKLVANGFDVTFDETASIGKRYRRQDAIGTFYCITIDYDTESAKTVTIRNRDTMEQTRIAINEIETYLK